MGAFDSLNLTQADLLAHPSLRPWTKAEQFGRGQSFDGNGHDFGTDGQGIYTDGKGIFTDGQGIFTAREFAHGIHHCHRDICALLVSNPQSYADKILDSSFLHDKFVRRP